MFFRNTYSTQGKEIYNQVHIDVLHSADVCAHLNAIYKIAFISSLIFCVGSIISKCDLVVPSVMVILSGQAYVLSSILEEESRLNAKKILSFYTNEKNKQSYI